MTSTRDDLAATAQRSAAALPQPSAYEAITSVADWEADSHHTIWTHGGKRIVVQIPDLFDLVRADALPEHLRSVAITVVQRELELDTATPAVTEEGKPTDLTWTTIKEAAELFEHLSYGMVVKPELTVEQFRRLPTEDREMLRDIAMRNRNTDAKGVRLGVEPLSRWEQFRSFHRCPEMCPSCQGALDSLSTRGGEV